jgi:CysZ protein
MARQGPKELPANLVAQAFRGLAYPIEGLRFIRQHRLWGMAMVPTIVNIALFILLLVATIWLAVPQLEKLDLWLAPGEDSGGFARGVMSALSWIVWIVAILVVVILDAILLFLLGQAVAGPFLDLLSEKVESLVLGGEPPAVSWTRSLRSIVVGLSDIVWTVIFFALVNVPLALIGLTAIGSIPAAIASFGFTALLLSQEFVGLSLTRQLVSYPARFKVVWGNRWLSLGFGTTSMLLLAVPVLNLLLLPIAAAGGTLLYCDLKAAGRINIPLQPTPGG